MFCKKCGSPIKEGVKFCIKCGEPVIDTNKVPKQTEPDQLAHSNGNPHNKGPNKFILGILAFVIVIAAILILVLLLNNSDSSQGNKGGENQKNQSGIAAGEQQTAGSATISGEATTTEENAAKYAAKEGKETTSSGNQADSDEEVSQNQQNNRNADAGIRQNEDSLTDHNADSQTPEDTDQMEPMDQSNPSDPTEAEARQDAVQREATFHKNLTYKFKDLYKAKNASDAMFTKAANHIKEYNDAWIAYVNDQDDDVYDYIKHDSSAYQNAISYGQKDIYEELESCYIKNVMKYKNYYYAWSDEVINVYDNDGLQVKKYHWIYKIYSEDGQLYIEDYTRDPQYQ